MRIGLLGGAGFIGTYLHAALEVLGHEIVVIDDFTHMARFRGLLGLDCERINNFRGVRFDKFEVEHTHATHRHPIEISLDDDMGLDYLVNLAADPVEYPVDGEDTQRQFRQDNQTNMEAAQYARRHNIPLLFMSSVFAIGDFTKPATERIALKPKTPYGIIKAAGEFLATNLVPKHLIIRTTSVFGYGDLNNRATQIILNRIMEGKRVKVNEYAKLDFTYVQDLAYQMAKLIDMGATGVFNITGEELHTLTEYAEICYEFFGHKPNILRVFDQDRPQRNILKNTKFRRLLPGFKKMPFKAAVLDYCQLSKLQGGA